MLTQDTKLLHTSAILVSHFVLDLFYNDHGYRNFNVYMTAIGAD
jgi:hypothetical protein